MRARSLLKKRKLSSRIRRAKDTGRQIENLISKTKEALASFNVLFQRPSDNGLDVRNLDQLGFLTLYQKMLLSIETELELLSSDSGTACREMVYAFLISLGMKKPPHELVSVIAADYVDEFVQHVFEELSPRTLVRYLERYYNDVGKRKRMLDFHMKM